MKKLISLLAALAVVTTGTAAFAADGFTVETTTNGTTTSTAMTVAGDEATVTAITKDAESGLYEVDLATVAGSQDQTTILAIEGKAVKVGSIKYINQSATPSFSFDMDDPTETVYVLAGGSAINPTLVAKIEVKADEPETFTISGTVTGYVGATLPTVVANDGTTDYAATVNADGTFTVDVPVLTEGSYTLTATKESHLGYTKANASTDAIAAKLAPGEVVVDNIIDIKDVLNICGSFNAVTGDENYTTLKDVNEDNILDIKDILLMCGNFNATPISE